MFVLYICDRPTNIVEESPINLFVDDTAICEDCIPRCSVMSDKDLGNM